MLYSHFDECLLYCIILYKKHSFLAKDKHHYSCFSNIADIFLFLKIVCLPSFIKHVENLLGCNFVDVASQGSTDWLE